MNIDNIRLQQTNNIPRAERTDKQQTTDSKSVTTADMPYYRPTFQGIPKFLDPTTEKIKNITLGGEQYKVKSYKKDDTEYILTEDGKLYRMKYAKDKEKNAQMVLASKLYQLAGIKTPEMKVFDSHGYSGVATEYIEDTTSTETSPQLLYPGFGADVWLGHRNTYNHGNTAIDKDGKLIKLSMAGTLEYRASGKKKESFGTEVEELQTLRNPDTNPMGASLLSGMSDEDLKSSLQRIADIKKNDIILAVQQAGLPQSIADTLIARQNSIKQALVDMESKQDEPVPVEPQIPVVTPKQEEPEPVAPQKPVMTQEELQKRAEKNEKLNKFLAGEYLDDIKKYDCLYDDELKAIKTIKQEIKEDSRKRDLYADIVSLEHISPYEMHRYTGFNYDNLKIVTKLTEPQKRGYWSPLNEIMDIKALLNTVPYDTLDFVVNKMGVFDVNEVKQYKDKDISALKYCTRIKEKYGIADRIAQNFAKYAVDENGKMPYYKQQIISTLAGNPMYTEHWHSWSSDSPVSNLAMVLQACDTEEKAELFFNKLLPKYENETDIERIRYEIAPYLEDGADIDFVDRKIKAFEDMPKGMDYGHRLSDIKTERDLEVFNELKAAGIDYHNLFHVYFWAKDSEKNDYRQDELDFAKELAKDGFTKNPSLYDELFNRYALYPGHNDMEAKARVKELAKEIKDKGLLYVEIKCREYHKDDEKIKTRHLLKKEVFTLNELDEKAYNKVLSILQSDNKKLLRFSVDEAIELAKLSDDDWKKIDKYDLLNSGFSGAEIAQLGFMPEEGLDILKDRGLLTLSYNVRNDGTKYSNADVSMILGWLSDDEWKTVQDRNLLNRCFNIKGYTNLHATLDEVLELKDLDDAEYNYLNNTGMFDKYNLSSIFFYEGVKGIKDKTSIDQLSNTEKRQLIKTLVKHNKELFDDEYQKISPAPQFTPRNKEEYCALVQGLTNSLGLKTRPLSETVKAEYNQTLKDIESPYSVFNNTDFTKKDLKLHLAYSRDDFLNDIETKLHYVPEDIRSQVTDYFGFEYKKHNDGYRRMNGYPVVPINYEGMTKFDSATRQIILEIEPLVKRFSQDNKFVPNENISPELANDLNKILRACPELATMVGKTQHGTHDYTVDIHTLNVLQNVMKNPKYQYLPEKDRRVLQTAVLYHDITKLENNPEKTGKPDKSHPTFSAYDAYHLTKKLDISKTDRLQMYQLIKNHDFLEKYSPANSKDYAFELRTGNNFFMESILTEADLKSVKRNGGFYQKYSAKLELADKIISKYVDQLQKTSIPLPQTKIPKADKLIVDNDVVKDIMTKNSDGSYIENRVISLRPDIDLGQYGFEQGLNSNDLNVLIHALDGNDKSTNFQTLGEQDCDALLSTSYVNYANENYHGFRPQGYVLDVNADDIHAAYFKDFGSGYGKNLHTLKTQYLFNGPNAEYRDYVSNKLKELMNLDDKEFKKLYEQIKDKSIQELDKEKPEVGHAMRELFNKMEGGKRAYGRQYNEILVNRPRIQAVFCQGENFENGNIEKVPEYLRQYAAEHNVPIVFFGT